MKKQAVVYDKWLSTMGGGEVVACNFAKALIDNGYVVTFIYGKGLKDFNEISTKLGIDLTGTKFIEVWNDERKIHEITRNKDIFINASFMDYMTGKAKKNYYYTSFPTEPYNSPKSYLLNYVIYPILSKYIKPIEFLNGPKSFTVENGNTLYQLDETNKIAFSYLKPNKIYKLKFILFLEKFSKTNLETINWNIEGAEILNKRLSVDHNHNTIKYSVSLKAINTTFYLKLVNKNNISNIFLINAKISFNIFIDKMFNTITSKVTSRLRAGVFNNIIERMKSYDIVFANSNYTSSWIKKYWKCNSTVLYPPVNLIKDSKNNDKVKKNYICSVGRFFTLGHGKKQEIMIEAFKKMIDGGLKDWELHLAGGLSEDKDSQNFMKKLQSQQV